MTSSTSTYPSAQHLYLEQTGRQLDASPGTPTDLLVWGIVRSIVFHPINPPGLNALDEYFSVKAHELPKATVPFLQVYDHHEEIIAKATTIVVSLRMPRSPRVTSAAPTLPPLSSPSSLSISTSKLRLLILEPSRSPASPESCSSPNARYLPSSPPSQAPSLVPSLLQALTGEAPPPQVSSHDGFDDSTERVSLAGYTTHPPFRVRTRYFDTKVGLWCDEVPLPLAQSLSKPGSVRRIEDEDVGEIVSAHRHGDLEVSGPKEKGKEGMKGEEVAEPTTQTWLTQMLTPAPEAMEVRGVIGAIVLAMPVPDALEPSAASSSTATDAELGYGDDEDELPQPTGQSYWKLKPEYLDIIEAVNTLRSAIEDERAGQNGDVGAVILLQGSIPNSPTNSSPHRIRPALPASAAAYDNERNRADALVEAVEDQLLTDRAVLGWDIIAWNGIPKSPLPPTNTEAAASERRRDEAAAAAAAAVQTADDATEEARNLYGEKTGLPRLHELLHNVDWSALPPHQISSSTPSPPTTSPHGRASKATFDPGPDPDPDLDASLLSSDEWYDVKTHLTSFEPGHRDAADLEAEAEEQEEEEEFQVEQLQGLLQQAMAIREAGRDLESGERERYARRMVGRLMGDL